MYATGALAAGRDQLRYQAPLAAEVLSCCSSAVPCLPAGMPSWSLGACDLQRNRTRLFRGRAWDPHPCRRTSLRAALKRQEEGFA